MFLKALNLKGFKSFADPAQLVFEPGVTVVVGPNGSGKSNVVDAVAWVLGAQGPRTVRSSKMEDVIFAGSSDRPALGRAEVSLTIDNRSGKLPGGLAEITITRTLFRSGDSEYAINGQPCRLLDIQELLSDSGVGRQQHVIVGQGQLDHILNARPEDRRLVIEEAAGVLKHRRRRERAERRLAGAEENLERLGDTLREVRRQIRPLERQAAAARSHAGLASELRSLRLYLVGTEIKNMDARTASSAAELESRLTAQTGLLTLIGELDVAADKASAELSARREDDLASAVTRVQGLTERSKGLVAVLGERKRSLARALDDSADTDAVSTLEAEAARLSGELDATAVDQAALDPEAAAIEESERILSAEVAEHDALFGNVSELRSAEEVYAEARGRAEPLRRSLERDRVSLDRVDERLHVALQRRTQAADELATLEQELVTAEGAAGPAAEKSQITSELRRRKADALARAEEASRDAERARNRLEARAEALARAVDEARGSAGAQALSGFEGVIGTLDQLVEVDGGWRGAFDAAVGAAISSVVVDGSKAARGALERLLHNGSPGAILALVESEAGLTQIDVPVGAERVRDHVRPTVESLSKGLDRLLATAVAVDGTWEVALDVALARPELTVVTKGGDRFSKSGWRVHAEGDVTAAAAEDAAIKATEAAQLAESALEVLRVARTEAEQATEQATLAAREKDRDSDRLGALRSSSSRLKRDLAALDEEAREAERHRAELAERLERDSIALAELEERLPDLQEAATTAAERISQAREARRRLETRRTQVATIRRDLEVRAAGLSERRSVLADRLEDVERRLAGHAAARQEAAVRRQRLESDAMAVDRLVGVVSLHSETLQQLLGGMLQQRDKQRDEVRQGGAKLDSLRQQRISADADLSGTRQRIQEIQLELAETSVRRTALEESLGRELGCSLEEALAAELPELPENTDPIVRAQAIETKLGELGPVNPLALEELSALEERNEFLQKQVDDVKTAKRDLQQVVRTVDEEIVRVFAEAFADVNEHFQSLVATLFPGGTGRLILTDPANILETGIEVEARPPGKNVRKLTLLSGGERSMVALAFLFAVFRSRPSPFYLMDEVEAALDDVNLHRFLGLLQEFRDEAQLIVVSHQKRTMEAADALYGVTQKGGSSKVVSQKVSRQVAGEDEEG